MRIHSSVSVYQIVLFQERLGEQRGIRVVASLKLDEEGLSEERLSFSSR